MLKKILLAVVAVLLVLIAVIATRPATFRVERSAVIAAPSDVVFHFLNDFHHWGEFSPWDKLDPAMKRTYAGAESGVGAIYSWAGNDQVGEGRMTIVESKPNEKVSIKLEFLKPWESTNQTDFMVAPGEKGVSVTWAMTGNNDFMGKAFSLFMDMDAMVGKDFEQGLANLAAAVAKAAPKPAQPTEQTVN